MYTLKSLKALNPVFDSSHGLGQSDVNLVNHYVELIQSSRCKTPCAGDIIDYTDEYGNFHKSRHIHEFISETNQVLFYPCPFGPFVYSDKEKGLSFQSIPGSDIAVDFSNVSYVGKRKRTYKIFGRCFHPANSAIYFNALVNVWEYIVPDQQHPGYSTKTWRKHYFSYVEKPHDGSAPHYYDFLNGIVFDTAKEFDLWKKTYRAVEFPGGSPNQTVLFLYREKSCLLSREGWDALDLPLDTRWVNGRHSTIHIKVDYDDEDRTVTEYRFTNTGYLNSKVYGPYERAKGTTLIEPGPEIKEG